MNEMLQFVVRVLDLGEAEGRSPFAAGRDEVLQVQGAAKSLTMGATCLSISMPLFVVGLNLLTIGFMWWLESLVARPLAAALPGLVVLAFPSAWLVGFKLTGWKGRS